MLSSVSRASVRFSHPRFADGGLRKRLTRVFQSEPPGCRRCLPTGRWPHRRCPDEDLPQPYRLAKRYAAFFSFFRLNRILPVGPRRVAITCSGRRGKDRRPPAMSSIHAAPSSPSIHPPLPPVAHVCTFTTRQPQGRRRVSHGSAILPLTGAVVALPLPPPHQRRPGHLLCGGRAHRTTSSNT